MPRILLIEDDLDSRDLLGEMLVAGGYQVALAASETSAVRAARFGGHDLVLADLVLGEERVSTPWDYIDQIVDVASPAPVGLLSGWNVSTSEAREHGLVFVLRKPCSRNALFAQIASTLQLPALSPDSVGLLRAYFECIERGDYDRLRGFVASDVTYRLPGTENRFAKEVHGVEDFLSFTRATFQEFSEPHFALEAIRPLPRGALVEYVGSWRDGPDTRQMPGAVMFELRDGMIGRIEVRLNVDELP